MDRRVKARQKRALEVSQNATVRSSLPDTGPADKTVQWTVLSEERRELERAARVQERVRRTIL